MSVWMFTDPALAPLGPTADKPRVGTPTPSSTPTPQVRAEAQQEDRPPAEQVEYTYDTAAGVPAMERPWTHGGQYLGMQSSWAGWGQAGSRERYYALNRNAGGHVRASFNAATPSSGFGASRCVQSHAYALQLVLPPAWDASSAVDWWSAGHTDGLCGGTRSERAGRAWWPPVGTTTVGAVLGERRDHSGGEGGKARHF